MSANAEKKISPLLLWGGMGAAFFVLLAAVGGWLLLDRYTHVKSWTATTADVTWAGERCEMSYKRGKSWYDADVIDCSEAEAYKSANPSRNWRSSRRDFVTIAFEAGGARQEMFLTRFRISATPVNAGDKVAIFVDPSDPRATDRDFIRTDFDRAGYLAGGGLLAMLVLTGIGFVTQRRSGTDKSAPGQPVVGA